MRLTRSPRIKGAIRKSIDGYNFDSTNEARRYQELKLLYLAGEITQPQVHPTYRIHVQGTHVFDYEGDFAYEDEKGFPICEDVKGYRTDIYKLKIKCARAAYPYIKFIEVKCHHHKR